jgi:hypothetical protein
MPPADFTAAEQIGERPTYGIGLAMMTCWIIYWVRLAQSRKILARAASEADAKTRI